MTSLTLLINHSTTDSPVGTGGVDWISVDPNNDSFIFSTGSASGQGVSDGDTLPNETLLNRYAVQLSASAPVVVPKYFLAQASSSLLKECKLAGNQNKQYVFAAQFSGPTATEPMLEAWDNMNMSSALIDALGAGTPNSSWYQAITTNSGVPGANWVGVKLAGAGIANVLLMNDGAGALTAAGVLYFNFKIVIPAGYLTPNLATPTLAIVYTTN